MSSDLDGIADALLRIAEGDFCARIERSYDGEPFDVVACLINNMAQELAALFDRQAQARRELDEVPVGEDVVVPGAHEPGSSRL